ncbi:MAG: universal stress protein [Flavobacteriales bacterium]|nr:universal stress protein [Flavobacteriales bacterium]
MNTRILIPTDFSETAKAAFEYVYELFGKEAHYDILNCYYDLSVEGVGEPYMEVLKSSSEKRMLEEFDRIKEKYDIAEGKLRGLSNYGTPIFGIKSATQETKYDLVTMGTHGASGMKELFIGSNTAEALKNLEVPLLVVPVGAEEPKIENIVFAADYQFLDQDKLDILRRIAEPQKAKLWALHIEQPVLSIDDRTEQRVEQIILKRAISDFEHQFVDLPQGNIEKSITQFVERHDGDLLVMVRREYSFVENLIKTSQTKKMAMHTKVPLLVLPE